MATIEVPDFEGFECVGINVTLDDDSLYVLSTDGDMLINSSDLPSLFQRRVRTICYRKIKPKRIVFESTGEVRPPKQGEYFKTDKSMFSIELAEFDYQSKYEIYRVVEDQS